MNGMTQEQGAFLDQVRRCMENYLSTDRRRVSHALQVTEYARALLDEIEGDPVVTLAAAYLHDIGIPEAERKYGHCAGPLQESEGPPVARALLERLGTDPGMIDEVCALVGKHHTPAAIDSAPFRILWDADALVNLAEVVDGKEPERVESIIDKAFVTEPGRRRAREIYL